MPGVSIVGEIVDGWAHVEQSIIKILTTPLNTRVMRRDFGSEIPDLIDAPMTDRVVMAMFYAVAQALEPRRVDGRLYGEPRFQIDQVEVVLAKASGELELLVRGIYFPRGHLGDFSNARDNVVANIIF